MISPDRRAPGKALVEPYMDVLAGRVRESYTEPDPLAR